MLAQEQAAVAIAPDAVAVCCRAVAAPEHLAFRREGDDARRLVGDVDRAVWGAPDIHRVIEIAPLAEILAVAGENLHAVVFAIGDQHAVVGRDPDAVRRRELAGAGADAAPSQLMLTFGREA